ncbi:hypothetical protein [Kitasatospora cinereorecta]|uniref:DUF732 domain-containing protein n=1 Tax=Kitasatospora cinereorecta TaxID=285560 RepID=A0ABW0VGQ5_9ACTN
MRLRTLALAAAPLTAMLALTACSSSSTGGSAASPAASTTAGAATPGQDAASPADSAAASAPASKAAPPADAGLPPKPDAATTAKLIAALDAVDKDIVGGKPDQAVENARKQCQDIYNTPKDRAKLVGQINQRFTSPSHPNGFGPDTAEKILIALQTTICPRQ